jgi:hypothetical protein
MKKTQVFEEFLKSDEIFKLESEFRKYVDMNLWAAPYDGDKCQALYIYPGPSNKNSLCEFLTTKINTLLNEEHLCDSWHILNSYLPYGIHTDAYDDSDPTAYLHSKREGLEFGYTFLIPLSDYNSNTIVFNERAEYTKNWHNWRDKENIKPCNLIEHDTYHRYLNHVSDYQISYFSIDTIYPWKKGNLLIMPREAFHCSDNFLKNNIFEKRALIGWSYVKK